MFFTYLAILLWTHPPLLVNCMLNSWSLKSNPSLSIILHFFPRWSHPIICPWFPQHLRPNCHHLLPFLLYPTNLFIYTNLSISICFCVQSTHSPQNTRATSSRSKSTHIILLLKILQEFPIAHR